MKGDIGATQVVPLKIRVLPPAQNITCPYGTKPDDCMPKIKQITNGGLVTLVFPMPLESVLNETLFSNAS